MLRRAPPLLLAALAALSAGVGPRPSRADCDRSCPPAGRDPQGCCKPPPPRPAKPPPGPPPAKPPPPPPAPPPIPDPETLRDPKLKPEERRREAQETLEWIKQKVEGNAGKGWPSKTDAWPMRYTVSWNLDTWTLVLSSVHSMGKDQSYNSSTIPIQDLAQINVVDGAEYGRHINLVLGPNRMTIEGRHDQNYNQDLCGGSCARRWLTTSATAMGFLKDGTDLVERIQRAFQHLIRVCPPKATQRRPGEKF